LSKTGLKIYYFYQHSKKAKKWPNGQTILFLANSFKKGQMATLLLFFIASGEPNGVGNENCIIANQSGKYVDVSCSQQFPIMCEKILI